MGTAANQDAFQGNTAELMMAISKDRKKHPEPEKTRQAATNPTAKKTSSANKVFGFVIALFIGMTAAVMMMQFS